MCSRTEATEKVRPLQGLCCRASPSKLDSACEDQLWDPEPFPLYATYNVSVLVHDPTEIVWKGESREVWKRSENTLVDHVLPDQCDWFARSHDQLNSRFNGHHCFLKIQMSWSLKRPTSIWWFALRGEDDKAKALSVLAMKRDVEGLVVHCTGHGQPR